MMKKRVFLFCLGLTLTGGLLSSAAPPARAQLFGPSDEEKAHEAGQDSQLNQLTQQAQQQDGRLQALEDKTRSLTESLSQATGANEELRHQIDLLNQKIDREERDFAYRLCMVSAQQLGAGGDDQGLNCAGAGTGAAAPPAQAGGSPSGGMQPGAPLPPIGSDNTPPPAAATAMDSGPDQSGAPRQLGRPPGVLGTLPSSPSLSSSPGVSAPPPPAGAPRATSSGQFDTAMNLLAKAQYDEAKAAFRGYADANPDDTDLSPQAIYWVGDIDYVQRDYPGAIRAFAEQIKKYPQSPRGPDSMLKLGQALLATGQTQEGCTTLGALKSKYPQASDSTLAAAAGARKAARCTR